MSRYLIQGSAAGIILFILMVSIAAGGIGSLIGIHETRKHAVEWQNETRAHKIGYAQGCDVGCVWAFERTLGVDTPMKRRLLDDCLTMCQQED